MKRNSIADSIPILEIKKKRGHDLGLVRNKGIECRQSGTTLKEGREEDGSVTFCSQGQTRNYYKHEIKAMGRLLQDRD